ncbi:MAG: thiamine pyrophosphate-binding protein [Deltaproteobacteria bacterium]|nr:thiamine pyrophosphate-binding protein [Deltaproteobacteria bacterium]
MKNMKTIADQILEILEESGVEVLFGIPSIHNIGLYEALRKTPGMKHILCRHESTATHMADGYARESGKIGVVITSTGPGAGYTVPALQEAFGSSVPLLVIATNIPSSKIGKGSGALHELENQEEIFRNITKAIYVVRSVSDVACQTRKAIEAAQTGRPGPVYLEIPTDLFNREVGPTNQARHEITSRSVPLPDLRQAIALLQEAENPLILTGPAALRAGLSKEIITLAETLAAPVLFSPGARGMVPDDQPFALGNGARRGVIRETVASADLALAVGTRLREVDGKRRGLWLPRLIHMEWDNQWIGKNFQAEIALTGDLVQVVRALIKRIGPLPRAEKRRGRIGEIIIRRDREADRIAGVQPELAYLHVIRSVMPRESTLVVDNTQLGYWSEYFYPSYVPGGWMGAKGSAIIGFAFAAAMGAKIAAPDKPVVSLIGDGGFLYSTQELATCVRHGIGFPLIVVNSRSYGIIGYLQKKFYRQEHETRLKNPDFVRLAEAYGIKGCRVTSPAELEEALEEALSSGEMRLIELMEQFPEPPFDKY